ncbi:MAG TPA: PH domain-containing protein [Halococcus sp.]|nr:PH domain-containing protein [Halococcus sp.]
MASSVESTAWVHLTEDERVLWAGTRSLYPATPAIAFGFMVSFLGVWLSRTVEVPVGPDWLSLCLLPIGVFVGVWMYLSRWSTRYVFTTKAVYEKTGLLSRTVTRVRFDHVQNTAFEQSWIERLLSYGDIEVYTAGSGGLDLTLSDVPDPKRVNALITTQLSQTAPSRTNRSSPVRQSRLPRDFSD